MHEAEHRPEERQPAEPAVHTEEAQRAQRAPSRRDAERQVERVAEGISDEQPRQLRVVSEDAAPLLAVAAVGDGGGRVEQVVGHALAERRRMELVNDV